MSYNDDPSYGDSTRRGEEGDENERGFVGDAYRQVRDGEGVSSFFSMVSSTVQNLGRGLLGGDQSAGDQVAGEQSGEQSVGGQSAGGQPAGQQQYAQTSNNRFGGFAGLCSGNDVKWYVDGCGYMWAVSVALEQARESIWILDWWLSPELYLRRPPSQHEQYRLDRMLQAAAERGVKVNIIVYKEVAQALTRKYLSPTVPRYLHSLLPRGTDALTSLLVKTGLAATFAALEHLEAEYPLIAPPLTVSSVHTKHALEALHPNISVFRHPDHLPDKQVLESDFISSFQNMSMTAANISKIPGDALKALYGMNDDVILYWAHHEKLCLVDGQTAFMGGLDLCYGRWDTNQHAIADAHPGNVDDVVFPGQDYNNARIMDFQEVEQWENNKLSRKESSRMGWSDISISLHGPVVADLRAHFVQRWNFIHDEKYNVRKDARYSTLSMNGPSGGRSRGPVSCQLVRSAAKWSHGIPTTEHSIQNAYIDVISNSQHFIYIENQFFITATGEDQKPVGNQIGAAIVERILRAARSGQKFKAIVIMPAVPAFAGDLEDDDSLGTRAIMEYQYNSINRGGHSIMEEIEKAGFDAREYIRFYNLRSYDRINASASMQQAEEASGVDYERARREHDNMVDPEGTRAENYDYRNFSQDGYNRYQEAARSEPSRRGLGNGRWDSVSECYMLGGQDIREVPWEGGDLSEMDAFVSEELYVHSKVLIADDRTVICGSANLNDRSQLGNHDSEIAMVIEDQEVVESYMDGRPWEASRFGASLRRQLFRKHLGLLPPQTIDRPDENFQPIGVPNAYDFGSPEDRAVEDPLSDNFLQMWEERAEQNTSAFARIFHPVPHDSVRNWKDYGAFYKYYFHAGKGDDDDKAPPKYRWGHVVAENFSPGDRGVQELKDLLSTIRGTLVQMPLNFLIDENIAREGLTLNALTETVYT